MTRQSWIGFLLSASLLIGALSGCGGMEIFAMLGERPVELADAPGCTSKKSAPRAYQYRAQVQMGTPPPSRAKRGKQSYVGRNVVTKEVESSFTLHTALVVVEGILLCVALFFLLVAVGVLFNKEATRERKMALMAIGLGTLLAGTVCGYFGGSVVSLDNPTNGDVTIKVNGQAVAVPAKKFTDVRVVSNTVRIETEADGEPVEELTMTLDDGPFETLFRSTLGDGRYIYSVCGTTKYFLGSAKYE